MAPGGRARERAVRDGERAVFPGCIASPGWRLCPIGARLSPPALPAVSEGVWGGSSALRGASPYSVYGKVPRCRGSAPAGSSGPQRDGAESGEGRSGH